MRAPPGITRTDTDVHVDFGGGGGGGGVLELVAGVDGAAVLDDGGVTGADVGGGLVGVTTGVRAGVVVRTGVGGDGVAPA